MGNSVCATSSAMKIFLICLSALLFATETTAKHAATDEAMEASEQVEINAMTERYLAILENMTDKLNRGMIFDTATTPAWAKKLFTDLFGLLTWALTETLSGSGVAATPGPGRR